MLSDEERENLIKKLGYCEQEYEQNGYLSVGKFKAIRQAVKLIKKQSKEIKELKMQLEVEKIDNKYNQEETHEETIPRYKLKEVLEKYKYTEIGNSEKIIEFYKELQSLLEKE